MYYFFMAKNNRNYKSFSRTAFSLFSLAVISVLAGCGTTNIESRRNELPQVRDVPFQARETEDLRKKVIVLPVIDSELQRSSNIVEAARRAIVEDLLNSKNYIVINNSDLPQDMKSFVKENKEYDMAAVSRVAANLGAAAVVEGRILEVRVRRLGDEIGVFRKIKAQVDVSAQIRVFAAKSAREILNTMRTAQVQTETTKVGESSTSNSELQSDPALVMAGVRKAFKDAVGPIVRAVEKLNWEGRVALVTGEKIYINAGRISGIQVGDILRVTEEGAEIFDPETGGFIGQAPGRVKGTLEVVTYFGKDGAIGIVHSGSGFKENDRVEMY